MLIGRAMSMMTVTVGVLCGVRLTMAKGSGGFTHTTERHGHAPWVWGGYAMSHRFLPHLGGAHRGGFHHCQMRAGIRRCAFMVLGCRAIGKTACGKGIMDNIECIYVAGMGDGAMNDSEARA